MDNVKMGNFIRKLLNEKGFTQEKIAELLGISNSAVSQFLNGTTTLQLQKLTELSKILDVPLDLIVYGGDERETHLERLAKKNYDEIINEDPEFKFLKEKDSKGKDIYFYLLKHDNLEAIEKLKNKGSYSKYDNNIKFLRLLIQNERLDILNDLNQSFSQNPQTIIRIGKPQIDSKYFDDLYVTMDQEEKLFVESYVKCKNRKILEVMNFISLNDNDKRLTPAIVFYAIRFDQTHILEIFDEYRASDEKTYNHINDRRNYNLLGYAMKFKSLNSIEYYYKKVNTYNFNSYFSILSETKDPTFIEMIRNKYKNKGDHSFNQTNNKFDNSKELIEHVKNNDVRMVEYSAQFSDQLSLNKALLEVKVDQIEIIKILINSGAKFVYINSYDSKTLHDMDALTGLIKYLISKVETK